MHCYQHILMATDSPDGDDLKAAQKAAELAKESGATLSLLHVTKELNRGMEYALSSISELEDEIRERAETGTRVLGEKVGVPANERFVKQGLPTQTICDHAENSQTDLIVVGNRRRGIMALFTIARAMISNQPCDVLIVKE